MSLKVNKFPHFSINYNKQVSCSQNSEEMSNSLFVKSESETMKPKIKNKGNVKKSYVTDQTETCDQKTRIIGSSDNKHNQTKPDYQFGEEESFNSSLKDVNMPKLPSYFLQVEEVSIIFQQPNQSTIQQSRNQSNLKGKPNQQKIMKKVSNTEEAFKNAKQTQLMFSSRILVCYDHEAKQRNAYIWDKYVGLGEEKIPINQITKAKCLLEGVTAGQRKIKVVQNYTNIFYFSASVEIATCCSSLFSEHYLWFSKIIMNKMEQMKYLVKPSKLIGNKKPELSPRSPILIQGHIYKKSKYLNNWQPRYIVITEQQIFSYRQINQKPTYQILSSDTKYLWTRFHIQEGQLVLKLKHGLAQTEFAIPVVDFCSKVNGNWLYAFYRFMVHDKQYL